MISVIVCSRFPDLFEALSRNLSETIGVKYEIIRIDNSSRALGITAAYNKGASKAKYPFLCFVHEDVQFKTNDWGVNLVNHFLNDNTIGLIGIAGGIYKKRMFSGLGEFETNDINIKRINIIQHFKFSNQTPIHLIENPEDEWKAQVVTLDGVFLTTRKEIWNDNKFDEKLLKGFHGYDLDFSLQIGKSKKLFVVYDVLLEHFSEGKCDMSWELDIIAVHKKWRNKLPVAVDLSIAKNIDIYNKDWDKVRRTMNHYIESGCSYFTLVRLYNSLFSLINFDGRMQAVLKDYWVQLFIFSKYFFSANRN